MPLEQASVTVLAQTPEFEEYRAEIYRRLDPARREIRLLHILQGRWEDEEIRVSLDLVSLDDKPVYDPLSYCWDIAGSLKTITVNDHHGFNVTQNQFAALRRFRQEESTRVVWMDAICINQADLVERQQQVGIMGDIYSHGGATQIWIGEPDAFWPSASFKTVRRVWPNEQSKSYSSSISPNWSFLKFAKWPSAIKYALDFVLLLDHFDEVQTSFLMDVQESKPWYESIALLNSILNRPWFKRVWVIQEVALSKDPPVLHVGKHAFSFEKLLNFGVKIAEHESCQCSQNMSNVIIANAADIDVLTPFAQRCKVITNFRLGRSITWFDVLGLAQVSMATDARDHIYGLLALTRGNWSVRIDYTLSVAQAYALATYQLMKAQGNLQLLYHASTSAYSYHYGLASWSVDFSDRSNFRQYMGVYGLSNGNLDTFVATLDLAKLSLSVLGYPLGAVKYCLTSYDNLGEDSDVGTLGKLRQWINELRDLGWFIDENVFLQTVFLQTILFNTIPTVQDVAEPVKMDWRSLDDLLSWWRCEDCNVSGRCRQEQHDWIVNSIEVRCVLKGLFITQDEWIGIGPKFLEKGDQLFALKDCPFTVALRLVGGQSIRARRLSRDSTAYHLLGDCYIGNQDDAWSVEEDFRQIEIW